MIEYFKVWQFWAVHAGVVVAAFILACMFFMFEFTATDYLLMVATLAGIGWASLWAYLTALHWCNR